jgi:hypothetical protein
MSSTQLSFALRTTSNVKTVHLIGSWDAYQGQLPLSRDSSRSGSWKGTFKFQPNVLEAGQRYWFYYMMDGYKVSHDPTKEAVVEPTTGRTLNILDVPKGKSSSSSGRHHSSSSSKRSSTRRHSREVPRGRAVPEGAIACPKPQRPGVGQHIIEQAQNQSNMDQLTWHLANASLQEEAEDDDSDEEEEEYDGGGGPYVYDEGDQRAYLAASDDDSDAPSLTSGSSRSSGSSSPSSVSSACSCERYAVTRAGDRVRLDCGGSVCGSSEDSDDGSSALHCRAPVGGASTDEDDDDEDPRYRVAPEPVKRSGGSGHLRDSRRISRHHGSSRRHGMVMG